MLSKECLDIPEERKWENAGHRLGEDVGWVPTPGVYMPPIRHLKGFG
jgi:hypothetical protein